MTRRWGQNPENLTDSRSTWDLEPDYLSFAIVNLIFAYSPKCIILGGAAINPGLFATIRLKVKQLLNNCFQSPMLSDRMEDYILPLTLGNRSGGLGAIAIARKLELNRTQEVKTLQSNKPYKHSGSLVELTEGYILNNRKQDLAFGHGFLGNIESFQ